MIYFLLVLDAFTLCIHTNSYIIFLMHISIYILLHNERINFKSEVKYNYICNIKLYRKEPKLHALNLILQVSQKLIIQSSSNICRVFPITLDENYRKKKKTNRNLYLDGQFCSFCYF